MRRPASQNVVIGVDPGARHVGLVARRGHDCLLWSSIDRKQAVQERTSDHPDDVWAVVLADLLDTFLDDLAELLDTAHLAPPEYVRLVAHERTSAPNPHAGMTNPGAAIDTAFTAGTAVGWAWARGLPTISIAPDRHGRLSRKDLERPKAVQQAILRDSYPPALVGPREVNGEGKSPRQHARAAWDVSRALEVRARLQRKVAV